MIMKGYSQDLENVARARAEGVEASYKDLSQVCGMIARQDTGTALTLLELASTGVMPVPFKRFNKKLGHRRELGGQKGRYPMKAAVVVLKLLKSAIANGKVLGLGDKYQVVTASTNVKAIYPRMASKGRTARSNIVLSRVEVVLKPLSATPTPKEIKPKEVAKKEEPKAAPKHEHKEVAHKHAEPKKEVAKPHEAKHSEPHKAHTPKK
jgi:large subunit ribosomal protein L22